MPSFFVKFTHGLNRESVGMMMNGASGRDVAREIREKYRNVEIEAIKASGEGRRASRRPGA